MISCNGWKLSWFVRYGNYVRNFNVLSSSSRRQSSAPTTEPTVSHDSAETSDSGAVVPLVNQRIGAANGRLFAVVGFADKQFKVTDEDIIVIQGHYDFDIGDRIILEKVLCVGAKDFTLFGTPYIPRETVRVEATVIEKTLSENKIKYFSVPRKGIRILRFFRDPLSLLRISRIQIHQLQLDSST